MDVRIKRVYAPPAPDDGFRILVDRIWPRGVSKAGAALDLWLTGVAPSTELRRWFGHDPERMAEFTDRYAAELDANPAATELRGLAADRDRITLVYSAHDELHNQAVVLAAYLMGSASA
ncbi:MAG: DUF488 domain-containing protein [Cellulomonas sp.]|nr:DUF488 domain-containing protein [Cellulomonas sp.]